MKSERNTVLLVFLSVALQVLLPAKAKAKDGACENDTVCRTPSVFDNPTAEEINNVIDYMKRQSEFNIVDGDIATPENTYIHLVDGLFPPKTQTLDFLNGNGTRPQRMARVIMYRGDLFEPKVEEYLVGPLDNITGHTMRRNSQRTYSFPYKYRQWSSGPEVRALKKFLSTQLLQIDHILKEVTGHSYNNCSDYCLSFRTNLPGEIHTSRRKAWVYLTRKVAGDYLHPVGAEFRINAQAADTSGWRIDYVWLRGRSFNTLTELIRQYASMANAQETFTGGKEPLMYDGEDPNLYSSFHRRGDPLPKDSDRRGPETRVDGEPRYTVTGHQVEWQGWRFDFAMRTIKGLQLYDVRFKGERIAYEVSVAELGVFYGGYTPAGSHEAFTDSQFYLGSRSQELIRGLDCMQHSTFFDFVHYTVSKPDLHQNSACLFEWNTGVPLRRHYAPAADGGFGFVQGMPDNALVLRAIITIGNYDYILDYTFHQNGVLEVVTSLNGQPRVQFFTGDDRQRRYGFQIVPEGIGNIHNHLLNFKVDLDVFDTRNRFETLDFEIDKVDDPTEPGRKNYVHAFRRNVRSTESEATCKYNMDTPKYLLFYKEGVNDRFDNPRSYRLYPVTMSKLMLPEDWAAEKAFSWARNQIAVTKYKPDEDTSSSIYNSMSMSDPPFQFQNYIDDNDSILDEDLVAWVTLGIYHLPRTEDIPGVQTPGAQLRFFLSPYNFFPEDPSLASRDNIRVTQGKDGGHNFQYVGTEPESAECSASHARAVALTIVLVSVLISEM